MIFVWLFLGPGVLLGMCYLSGYQRKYAFFFFLIVTGTSLVAQWLRIRLAIQGTQVQSLVRNLGPVCQGATKPTATAGESTPLDQEPGATLRPNAAKQINVSKDR